MYLQVIQKANTLKCYVIAYIEEVDSFIMRGMCDLPQARMRYLTGM